MTPIQLIAGVLDKSCSLPGTVVAGGRLASPEKPWMMSRSRKMGMWI